VAGRRISQGSRLFEHFIPPADAIAVERVKAAGAVVIGIGNAPEFACKGQTNSPLHGLARHPMDPSLTPGGSSGGRAAPPPTSRRLHSNHGVVGPASACSHRHRRLAVVRRHTLRPRFQRPFCVIAVIAPMGGRLLMQHCCSDAVTGAVLAI
jgi:aspartyl-tRNA(Asn)/glutamyl-tRNA(Gln) amidotransferase subunit A